MKWAKEVCFRSQHRESPGTVLVPHPVQCDVIETGDSPIKYRYDNDEIFKNHQNEPQRLREERDHEKEQETSGCPSSWELIPVPIPRSPLKQQQKQFQQLFP